MQRTKINGGVGFDVVIFDILIPPLSINHVSFDRLIDFFDRNLKI